MEVFKTSMQHAKDSTKEFSRIGANAAKTFEQQTSRDSTRQGGGSYDSTRTRVSVDTEQQDQDRARRQF